MGYRALAQGRGSGRMAPFRVSAIPRHVRHARSHAPRRSRRRSPPDPHGMNLRRGPATYSPVRWPIAWDPERGGGVVRLVHLPPWPDSAAITLTWRRYGERIAPRPPFRSPGGDLAQKRLPWTPVHRQRAPSIRGVSVGWGTAHGQPGTAQRTIRRGPSRREAEPQDTRQADERRPARTLEDVERSRRVEVVGEGNA